MADEIVAPVAGTPEYDAAMSAKLDANAEAALVAAGVKAPAEPAPDAEQKPAEKAAEEPPQEDPAKASEDAAREALAETGLDFNEFSTEFADKGELSKESYEKMAKVGIPAEMVDAFIAGQNALAAARTARGYEAAGGNEQLTQMQDWAKGNLSKAEIDLFNESVAGSEEEMMQAVLGLRSRFEAEYGRMPGLIGGRVANGSAGAYQSRAEMVSDMKDPRYTKDPAFRATVERRVANTTAF
jgi:pyruvate/2-oxoglutarate dehydrogenase complex dihydrolipoamide acyltransferase (E2) component